MKDINYKIVSSIGDISRDDFKDCVGDIAEGYEFFQTLEASCLEGFFYFYILVYRRSELVLIAPLFTFDFDLSIGLQEEVEQNIVKTFRRLWPRLLIMKTLFCGSPIGEYGFIGIKKHNADHGSLIDQLLQGIEDIRRQQKIPFVMFKDFFKHEPFLFTKLRSKGFFQADSFPSMVVDLPFESMDAYLASLSHATRKDLRRKIKKAHTAGYFTAKVVCSVEEIIDDIYALYLNTYYNAGPVRFEKLTKEFFIQAGRLMPSRFFLYYCNDQLAAFNFCILHHDTLIDKFIGMDYSLTKQFPLYFLTWLYNIQWCLDNGIKHYKVGQTDYEPKIRLGGRKIPLYVYFKHRHGLIHRILSLMAGILEPNYQKQEAS